MSKTAAVIANPTVAAELGHLGEWLDANDFEVRRLTRDDVLEIDAADGADLLIVMGSVWTLVPDRITPETRAAIDAEIALVRRWVELDRPLFGICFGGQLLSAALDGNVRRLDHTHMAWETPATELAELNAPWVFLHQDAFSVPDGVELLASGSHAPVAVRRGRAWGVQFHPEVDEGVLTRMFADIDAAPEVSAPHIDSLRSRAAEQRADSLRLFDRFWAEAGA